MSTETATKRKRDPAVTEVTRRSVTPWMFFTVAAIVAAAVALVGIFMVTDDQPAPGSTGFDRSEELVEKIQRQQILQKERSS